MCLVLQADNNKETNKYDGLKDQLRLPEFFCQNRVRTCWAIGLNPSLRSRSIPGKVVQSQSPWVNENRVISVKKADTKQQHNTLSC
jgi:hypothetical protein